MAEASATSAFAAARDGASAIGQRLDALGPGTDALFGALAKRLGALPGSAGCAPFGAAGSLAQALAGEPPTATAVRARRGPPKAPASARRAPQTPTPAAAPAHFSEGLATLGAALAGRATGAARQPDPDLARSLIVEPALAAMATLARLTRGAAAAQETVTRSPLAVPAGFSQQVAQWLAEHIEQATVPSLAASGAAIGGAIGGLLSSQELLARGLAGLGAPAQQHAAPVGPLPAPEGSTHTAPQTARETVAKGRPTQRASPAEPAPRAGSKLLPLGPDANRDSTAPAADRVAPADPASPACADDPIDAMTRALVDQAWLRGVDLR
ncbi:MAG: hypothetical protein ABIX46_14695 [Burkholderiaceae bacterium]